MPTLKKYPLEVTIIPAYCRRNAQQLFGIRTEKIDGIWVMNWAFKMTQSQASRENYLYNSISGIFDISTQYPGCPYCGASGFFQCPKCNSIICCNEGSTSANCPKCRIEVKLVATDTFDNISTRNL